MTKPGRYRLIEEIFFDVLPVFTDQDIQAAEVIQVLQSLGMSLEEIAAINEERRNGELTCERSLKITSGQLVRLEAKATELDMMISYVRPKIAWLTHGRQGRRPQFGSYMRRGSRINVEQTDSAVEETVNQRSIA
jgi:DNA-binding transcriptional MerR regulator